MKEIIKRYYELDDETKDMLYAMSLFHELENQAKESDNEFLDNLGNEEKLLELTMICSYLTQLDGSEIIRRLIEILNCRDITIEDIDALTTDELKELILDIEDEEDKEDEKNPNLCLIKKFLYNDANCLFLKDTDKEEYIIVYKKHKDDKNVRALTFKSLENLISLIVDIDIDINNECENADGT